MLSGAKHLGLLLSRTANNNEILRSAQNDGANLADPKRVR